MIVCRSHQHPGLLSDVHPQSRLSFQSSLTVGSPARDSTKQAHPLQTFLKEIICLQQPSRSHFYLLNPKCTSLAL